MVMEHGATDWYKGHGIADLLKMVMPEWSSGFPYFLQLNMNLAISFIGEFYQTFRQKLTPILLKFFQKILEKRMFLLLLKGQP